MGALNGNGNGRLTDKQALFIEKYLQCFNATEACRGIYESEDDNVLGVIGHENLRKPKIAERISQRLQESAMSADEVLMRLAEIARAEHSEFIGDGGHVNLAELRAAGKMHLVRGTRWTKDGDLIVSFADTDKALELIGKHHGLFTDKVEHDISVGVNVYIPDNQRDG
jgi:phage terminase small subunit